MKTNVVSAVIITHNRKKLLERAINSVLNQTYKDIEIIVVNDNSTDGTKEYLNNISNQINIKAIHIDKPHKGGGSFARNIGIKHSNGSYIALLDDDDMWLPTKIEKQCKFLNDNEKYGMVYCRRINQNLTNGKEKIDSVAGKMSGDLSTVCFEKTICTSSSMMLRKNLIDKIGLFDENLRYWQDFELNIRIANSSLIGYIDEPLMVYNSGNNDKGKLTNKYSGWRKSITYIENKHKNKFENLSNEDKRKWKLMIYKDAARRCKKSHLYSDERKYRFKVLVLNKSFYNLVRFLVNK